MKVLIIIILFTSCIAQNYNDDWFRYFGMPVAAAAYNDDPSQCWSNMQPYVYGYPNVSYSIYRQYTVRCESLNDTCSAYIAIQHYFLTDDIVILVVFRGTNNNYAFFENGWNYDEMVPFVFGGKVSKVFFDAFNDLWINGGMRDDVYTLKNKYSNVFRFFGHSLGGAIASLAATTVFTLDSNLEVALYTFGPPRVGDRSFANAFMNGEISSIRIIHKADIVPHLPPKNETIYQHPFGEFWYNNDMGNDDTYVECDGIFNEDPKCSDSLPDSDYNMDDHKNYFGRDFIEYGKSGCPDLKTIKPKQLKFPENRSKPYNT